MRLQILSRACLILLVLLAACDLRAQSGVLIPYRDGKKWGYANRSGKVVIVPQWDGAEVLHGNRGVVKLQRENGLVTCIIDSTGRYIVGPDKWWNGEWESPNGPVHNCEDSLGLKGKIDTDGAVLIPRVYGYLSYLSNAFYVRRRFLHAVQDERESVLNEAGVTVLPPGYRQIIDCVSDNPATFHVLLDRKRSAFVDTSGGILHLIDTAGYAATVVRAAAGALYFKVMEKVWFWREYPAGAPVRTPYNEIQELSDGATGLKKVRRGTRWGVVDSAFREVIPPAYTEVYADDSLILAETDPTPQAQTSSRYEYRVFDPRSYRLLRKGVSTPRSAVNNYLAWKAEHQDEVPVKSVERDGHTVAVDSVVASGYRTAYRKGAYVIDLADREQNGAVAFTPASMFDAASGAYLGSALVDRDLIPVGGIRADLRVVQYSAVSGKVLLERGGQYALADTAMRILIAFQPFPIDCHQYFERDGRPFAVIYHYKSPEGGASSGGRNLVDAEGHVLKPFRDYADVLPGAPGTAYGATDFFLVKDGQGRTGIVDKAGRVQAPEISFKLPLAGRISDGVYLIRPGEDYDRQQVVDAAGKLLYNGLPVQGVGYAYRKTFKYQPEPPVVPGIYVVGARQGGGDRIFYIDAGGRAFVGNWDF